jgi:hypothetical protein
VVLAADRPAAFLRCLAAAGPPPRAGALWLMGAGSLLPGAAALAVWVTGLRTQGSDLLLAVVGTVVLLTVLGPAPGSDPPLGRVRADRRAALSAAGVLAGVAGLAADSLHAAALAWAAGASAVAFARTLLLANGGVPGRLGIALGTPAGAAAWAGRSVRWALARGMASEQQQPPPAWRPPSLPGRHGPLAPDPPGWIRLEELGRRRLDWDRVEAELVLGGLLPAHRRRVLLGGTVPGAPGPLLAAAVALDARCDAAALFERVAVVLLAPAPAAAPSATPAPSLRRWRTGRAPYADVLDLLAASPAWHALVALAPSDRWADRALARLIVGEPDPGLRLEAIERVGPERFFAALGARPVDRGPMGALFVTGPPPLATALVRVVDAVAAPEGGDQVHWLPVPPHVGTAREAVAWTFGKTERDYAPTVET